MSDVDLVPDDQRSMAEALGDEKYAGLLGSTLRDGENVLLASLGEHSYYQPGGDTSGTKAMLILTDERLLAIRPRKRTITGKLKDQPMIKWSLKELVKCGRHRANDHSVILMSVDGGAASHVLNFTQKDRDDRALDWSMLIKLLLQAREGNVPNL